MSAAEHPKLLTRRDDAPLQRWPSDDGKALTWHSLFDHARTGTRGLVSGIAISPPGDRGRRHRHAQAEFYYILDGSGRIEVGDVWFTVSAGDALHIPGDAWHRIQNDGSADLRLVYVFPADSLDDVIYIFDETPDGTSPAVTETQRD